MDKEEGGGRQKGEDWDEGRRVGGVGVADRGGGCKSGFVCRDCCC